MYVRITSATGVTDIDQAVEMVRDHVVPEMQQQKGNLGLSMSGDRAAGRFVVLSLWESEEDMKASEGTADKVRQQTMDAVGGKATLEHFEQVYFQVGTVPPGLGSKLQVRRIKIDLSRLEENLEMFRTSVAPALSSSAGFQAVRQMINRQTGEGLVGTVWADDASLQAAAPSAERRRQAEERGVEFGEVTESEILYHSFH